MAAPGGKFFIEDKLDIPAKHHESFEQLWETKWKKPVGIAKHFFKNHLHARSSKTDLDIG